MRFRFFSFLMFFALILPAVSSKADDGCLVSGYGMFFQDPVASNPTTFFRGGSYRVTVAECSAGVSPSNSYYVVTTTSSQDCYAGYSGSGSQTNMRNYTFMGKKRVFNVMYCPIDDYIPALVLGFAGIGVFVIRRRGVVIAS
ncbi:MAG: hypothetical protein EOO98_00465 [Pedobacter sp.]|nr:MAG: hypothetical protein EOO98_00465 [Pedobacter sp.]